jgi:hypothetical protein
MLGDNVCYDVSSYKIKMLNGFFGLFERGLRLKASDKAKSQVNSSRQNPMSTNLHLPRHNDAL